MLFKILVPLYGTSSSNWFSVEVMILSITEIEKENLFAVTLEFRISMFIVCAFHYHVWYGEQ